MCVYRSIHDCIYAYMYVCARERERERESVWFVCLTSVTLRRAVFCDHDIGIVIL